MRIRLIPLHCDSPSQCRTGDSRAHQGASYTQKNTVYTPTNLKCNIPLNTPLVSDQSMATSDRTNSTTIIFVLLGLPDTSQLLCVTFVAFLGIYIMTLAGNLSVLTAIISNVRLHTPMYFFLANLSVLEMGYTTTTLPNILNNIIKQSNLISFQACICQVYFFTLCATVECVLLGIMAYDRYVAICIPLRYMIIMSRARCLQLASITWMSGILNSIIQSTPAYFLPYCGFNKIDRLYCEVQPLLQLSCSDTSLSKMLTTGSASFFGIGFMTFILVTYIFIVSAILRIPSLLGRIKAFSTCSSHITVVVMYYGALIFMYLRPKSSDSQRMDSVISAMYCMVIPVLNPIIYSLRNKDVKYSIRNYFMLKRFT